MDEVAERIKKGLTEEELFRLDARELSLFVKDFNAGQYDNCVKAKDLHSLVEFSRTVLDRLRIEGSCDPFFLR